MTGDVQDSEKRRVDMLRSYDLIDAPDMPAFDTIVHQAAAAFGTPMALLSVLDRDRQWFRARVGIDAAGAPIASSFCAHAIRGAGVMFVGDAARDIRFAGNPLVTGRPNIRFYAGAALTLDDVRIGTLCVLDDQPRRSFPPLQATYLTYLAQQTVDVVKAGRR